MCMHAKSLQSCLTLCDAMDYSSPGSSVHGILQQEYWSGLPCPPPRDLPNLGIKPRSPTLRWVLYCLNHCPRPVLNYISEIKW